MSVEAFQTYWRDKHPALTLANPGVRRNAQNHVLPKQYQGDTQPAYDGLAMLWFDDLEVYRQRVARQRPPRTPNDPPRPEGDVSYFPRDGRLGVILTHEMIIAD